MSRRAGAPAVLFQIPKSWESIDSLTSEESDGITRALDAARSAVEQATRDIQAIVAGARLREDARREEAQLAADVFNAERARREAAEIERLKRDRETRKHEWDAEMANAYTERARRDREISADMKSLRRKGGVYRRYGEAAQYAEPSFSAAAAPPSFQSTVNSAFLSSATAAAFMLQNRPDLDATAVYAAAAVSVNAAASAAAASGLQFHPQRPWTGSDAEQFGRLTQSEWTSVSAASSIPEKLAATRKLVDLFSNAKTCRYTQLDAACGPALRDAVNCVIGWFGGGAGSYVTTPTNFSAFQLWTYFVKPPLMRCMASYLPGVDPVLRRRAEVRAENAPPHMFMVEWIPLPPSDAAASDLHTTAAAVTAAAAATR